MGSSGMKNALNQRGFVAKTLSNPIFRDCILPIARNDPPKTVILFLERQVNNSVIFFDKSRAHGQGKNMRKIDFKNLLLGILLFCAALAIGILLIFRLTHRGHIGIGPVRFGKLFIIMCALLSGSIYFFKRM